MSFDDGPLYYREIQKNAYLKRVPNESTGSKLKQLGYKKVPLKPMWTLFCIHNGRTPYLEQYHEAEAPTTLSHKPVWRACLRTTRHVTASVRPRAGAEHDFLIDTDHGPVRMIAPDWDSMQEWVTTLRNKLHELKILSKGENVYCAAPAAPVPRAAARDPTSPLPPTPPVPPDRVPGIELIPPRPPPEEPEPTPTVAQPTVPQPTIPQPTVPQPEVDISNWEENPQPSTSTEAAQPKSVTKICGQNICLDDSILRRKEVTDSDEEFFAEVDRMHESSEDVFVDSGCEFKQTVVVGDQDVNMSVGSEKLPSEPQTTNVTVIQVTNKGPPHTAIPVLGPETDIFSFNFEQKLKIEPEDDSFVNIVNTEVKVQNDNGYGTVFSNDGEYGHLSLTTTVNLTDNSVECNPTETVDVKPIEIEQESVYERLCMASTSNDTPLNRLKNIDKNRKSSLPNLEIASTSESTYEYLFPNNNRNTTNINLRSNENHVNLVNGSNVNGTESDGRENNGNRPTEFKNRHTNLTNSVSVGVDPNTRALRSNIERSHSQNAYDSTGRVRENLIRRVQNNSPKRDGKNDKAEPAPAKPIWKRGLTELSLLTRLRGIGVGKRQESPTRQEENNDSQRAVTSPVKVVRRSRAEVRVDTTRRRSSSLSNGQSPPAVPSLQPLRARQAAALRAEQRRGAAVSATVANREPPIFADYDSQVWVCWWGAWGVRCGGRAGDRVAGLRAAAPRDAHHARQLVKQHGHLIDILFHRVPLGKIYVLNRRENESIGIKLDSECNIVSVDRNSPAGRAGLPPIGKWAVTEVNNRPLNLIKGGDEEMNRISTHGSEISVLIQPSALVKKLRAAIKANKHLLSIR